MFVWLGYHLILILMRPVAFLLKASIHCFITSKERYQVLSRGACAWCFWVELLSASLALKDFFLIVSKTSGKFLPQDGIGDYLSVRATEAALRRCAWLYCVGNKNGWLIAAYVLLHFNSRVKWYLSHFPSVFKYCFVSCFSVFIIQ